MDIGHFGERPIDAYVREYVVAEGTKTGRMHLDTSSNDVDRWGLEGVLRHWVYDQQRLRVLLRPHDPDNVGGCLQRR